VLVIEKCKFILYLKVMRHVPYLLFIHIGGCGNEEFTRFPNELHCIRCDNDMSLNVAYDFRIQDSIFVKQSYKNVTGKLRSITLATDIEFDQKKMSCRLHVDRGLISTNRYCRPANYIIDILQSKISFKADNKGYFKEAEIVYGYITTGIPPGNETCVAECMYLMEKSLLTAFYCDFNPPRNLQVKFAALWEPFGVKVWLNVGCTWFILILVLVFVGKCNRFTTIRLRFSYQEYADKFLLEALRVTRCILRQDESDRRPVLILFCFAMIVTTSLYENIITSKLIVPDVELVHSNVADLYDAGYKFSISIPLWYFRQAVESYVKRIGRVGLVDKMRYSLEDGGAFNIDSVADMSLRKSYVGHGTLRSWKYQTKYLKVKGFPQKCQIVTDPISESLDFITFGSFLTHEHMRMMSLLRDHGFMAWWIELEEYFEDMMFHILSREKEVKVKRSSNYISNLNLVPIFTVWFSFLVFSTFVFLFEWIQFDCVLIWIRSKILISYSCFKKLSFKMFRYCSRL
jgi:hypothetical protein